MKGPSTINQSLTAVPGLVVGHASDAEAATGCTVVLGPFRAAVDIRGLASGTRQLDSLSPYHLTPQVDALLFTGGSAYGLAAADGVAGWVEEKGGGFETDVGRRVSIVPTAVIYDLGAGTADRRPDAEMGRAACQAASDEPVAEGRVGVGTGATVGKLFGHARAMPGGLGSWAVPCDGHTVAALVVVNAFGDVVNRAGRIIAGARTEDGELVDTRAYLIENGPPPRFAARPGGSTTLAVVATDYPLSKTALLAVARQAMNAVVRRTSPANTQFDGDVVFAASTGGAPEPLGPAEALRLGLCAEAALEEAILRAVSGRSGGVAS